jgi:uncharacterized protein (TIGR00251 family)
MEELRVQQTDNTVTFSVKVVPRSSRTAIAGILGGMLKIKLAAAPEKGKANQALVEFLAVKITSGQTSPVKTIEITGISQETVQRQLAL